MTKRNDGLAAAILETADDFRDAGLLDNAAHAKITMRHVGSGVAFELQPLSANDIRALRERTRMSQAVFARHLNLTPGYVSQLERGAKRPTGAALALLDVVRRKGIEAIL
jgi:putative transcriptional regulator